MPNQQDYELKRVYLLSTEEPGDYIFTLSGVVLQYTNAQFTVYCMSSNHNLYRQALHRLDWATLIAGEASYRGIEFRLNDVTDDMNRLGLSKLDDIPKILTHLYTTNRRHLFFLEKHVFQGAE